MSAYNMTFCRTCGLWIGDESDWSNGEPGYCEKCKPASILKRMAARIGYIIRAVYTGIIKK
jgi:hypothetical protein